jgi:lipoteichoic acid synthase
VPALLGEDLLLAGLFALAVTAALAAAGVGRQRALSRAAVVAYLLLAAWIALNATVTSVLSSPLTAGLLHASGGALADSLARYVSPVNVGAPLALFGLALALAALGRRLRWRPPVWWRRGLLVAGLVLIAARPAALARVPTRGLHRNAVLALVETSWRRASATRPSSQLPPPCPAVDDRPGLDLGALAGAARGRHVVWVVLESAAARALSLYGAPRDVMPRLGALAADAVVWQRAYAAYPESIKGLFSMLCGRMPPPASEASDYAAGNLPCASVAGVLARAGYRTGLFHAGRFAYLGMQAVVADRGFGTLRDASSIASAHASSFGVDERSTVDALLAWADATPAGQPMFAVYLPIAGHHPYHAPGVAPRPLPERSAFDEYLNDLAVADDALGRLRDGLQRRGLDERTLYLVVGDHGEAFGEHPGNVAHALHLYEENVRVPFLVAAPGLLRGQRRASQTVSLIDLAPTTLALLGLPAPPAQDGRSALLPGPRVARFFTEQAFRRAGLVDGRWKLLFDADAGRAELFDLVADPGERRDVAALNPGLVASRLACLR